MADTTGRWCRSLSSPELQEKRAHLSDPATVSVRLRILSTRRHHFAAGAGGGDRHQQGAGQEVTGLGLPQRLMAVLDLVTRSPAGALPTGAGLMSGCFVDAMEPDRWSQHSNTDTCVGRQRCAGLDVRQSRSGVAAPARPVHNCLHPVSMHGETSTG